MSRSTDRRHVGRRDALRPIIALALIVVLYLIPQIGGSSTLRLGQYEEVLSFLIVAVALNIAMGYGGQYLIGITAVFAVGGYAAALAAEHHPAHVGLLAMCVIGGAVGALGGLVIGLPALRIGGFYLGLVSLFAALVVPSVAMHWDYAGGTTGVALFNVLAFAPKLSGEGLYALVVTLVLLATLFCWALVASRIGHRFAALRTSEALATSIGISGYRTKLLAILLSSALAGVAGGVYAYTQQFFAPGSSSPGLAVLILAGVVIGGVGTTTGPLVGGVIILGLNQFLTGFASKNDIVFGAALVAFAVFLPDGLNARLDVVKLRLGIVRAPPGGASAVLTPASAGTQGGAPAERDVPTARSALPAWTPVLGAASGSAMVIAGARRSFGGVLAVDDVDLTVTRGTVHGLVGSNGSGKTTLLNLISGFYGLDAGSIRIGDRSLGGRAACQVARAGVARTFQAPKLILGASSLDNVVPAVELRARCSGIESMLRLPRGIRVDRQARREATEILEALGLRDVTGAPASALPHGTRRMVEVARAIAMRPSYVLLDEPAAGLSPRELDLLTTVIRQLAEAGVGVLLIEHNLPMVLHLADEVTVLHQGRRLFHGTPEELRSNAEVASAFLGIDDEAMESL